MPPQRTGRKTILITGASSGLGAAIARELAHRGHRLALTARREDRLDEIAAEVRSLGGEALALPDDLTDLGAPGRIVAATVAHFGGLDALINDAGIGLPRYYSESDPEALRDQVLVNFAAPIVLTRHALPYLVESRGAVINIGSGVTAVANSMLGAYGATKAGLAYWNDALRRELRRRGVSVSLVDLGPVATEFFEAVRRRADDEPRRPLGIDPAPDGFYNPMRDRPPRCMTIPVDLAARRIARLIDHPRRRLALPRRVVWPFRLVGGLLGLVPNLADVAISEMIRRTEREEACLPAPVEDRAKRH
jgi:hypothetical protein